MEELVSENISYNTTKIDTEADDSVSVSSLKMISRTARTKSRLGQPRKNPVRIVSMKPFDDEVENKHSVIHFTNSMDDNLFSISSSKIVKTPVSDTNKMMDNLEIISPLSNIVMDIDPITSELLLTNSNDSKPKPINGRIPLSDLNVMKSDSSIFSTEKIIASKNENSNLQLNLVESQPSPKKEKEVRFIEPQVLQDIDKKTVELQMEQHRTYLNVKNKTYRVDGILGKGGSSVVYQVFDMDDKITKAIKRVVLSKEDETIAEGYREEVATLQKLQTCSGILKLFESDEVDEDIERVLYVVMEKGEMDLSKLMRSSAQTNNLNFKIRLWVQMLAAVNEIHKCDVIHSDLKPANFVIVGGKIKLIDFGIASSIAEDKTSIYKDYKSGTLSYMSPEAIQLGPDGFRISKKSDVWSLGCILFNWIYGQMPYHHIKGSKLKECAIANPDEPVKFPDVESIPDDLVNILKQCLQKDPKKRPTVEELLLSKINIEISLIDFLSFI